MRCPKCQSGNFETNKPCPQCGFQGEAARLEELGHLQWLLNQMEGWTELNVEATSLFNLKKIYSTRLKTALIDLGLRPRSFTPFEAEHAWVKLVHLEALFEKVTEWSNAGYFVLDLRDPVVTQRAHAEELRQRLEDYQRPDLLQTDQTRLDTLNFLLDNIDILKSRRWFKSKVEADQAAAPLKAERQEIQIRLGLIAAPKVEEPVQAEVVPVIKPVEAVPALPSKPIQERFWTAVLSERTLQGLIFFGILLLFAAAISFVIWGWKDFPALVRVAIPSGFTVLFFALGWLVQTRTKMHRSGIALSAIAALFIPIDCYITFFTYTSATRDWGNFWFWTSLLCVIAYVVSTLVIQSRFFGYLTGMAVGSLAMSVIEVTRDFTHLSQDWFTASLSVVAAGMVILAVWIARTKEAGRWRVFAEPFRYLGLIVPGVLMPLTLVMRLVTRDTFDALHYAMTVNWFVGGFIFGWGAVQYRSRSLGTLATISLPISVYMGQAAFFHNANINPAWHAFGLACLTPLYLYVGKRLLDIKDDSVLQSHGRTATTWGVALVIVAALYSLTDLGSGAPAAASHAVLAFSVAMASIVYQRPRYLYGASFFSFTALTFVMTELELNLSDLSVGWISLAIGHILLALYLGKRLSTDSVTDTRTETDGWLEYLSPLVDAAYAIAGLALLPPLAPYNGDRMVYALGNWLMLSAWGAHLAYKQTPGFLTRDDETDASSKKKWWLTDWLLTGAVYHWFAALPLPLWVWITFTVNDHPADYRLPLALAVLAWGMVFASHWLRFTDWACRIPWRLVGLVTSVIAVISAFNIAPHGYTPPLTLLLVGLLYFADTISSLEAVEFYPAGLVTAWGLMSLLDKAGWDTEPITFSLCLLIVVYFLAGLEAERRRSATFKFLAPLYVTAHLLTLFALARIAFNPLDELLFSQKWTEAMQLWGAADLIILAAIYALFAWGCYKEGWAHVAAWLGCAGGGLIAIVYSSGQGSLAAKGAVIASLFILAERGLNYLKTRGDVKRRLRALARMVWVLFWRPLLVVGWVASAGTIGLSLVRNLIWLGGGRIQQTWAAVGLTIIVALYALSARMFRQARFVWLAAFLSFIPWTIYHNLGWFTSYDPKLTEFAAAWVVLAWLSFLVSLGVARFAKSSYVIPLKTFTHILLPFSMLWAVADTDVSLITVGLSIALYLVSAWLLYHRVKQQDQVVSAISATRFLYPAFGLIPLWFVYLLDWLLPMARHEHFGLMLLPFGVIGLVAGLRLERIAPCPELKRAYGLPAYIVGYATLVVGTLLTAHITGLLVMVLLYDALLLAASAWIFKNPLWVYPASAVGALAFAFALGEGNVPANRQGWWLIGLAANYLLIGWVLRRMKLPSYAAGVMTVGFALIAFGLPPSSRDQVGAMWGYAGAALLYAVSAFWLRQPLLLVPASALVVVPYAVALQRSDLQADFYGLALIPGAVIALALGWLADRYFGAWKDFPWDKPLHWATAFVDRLLGWWGFSPYALGFGLAFFAPLFCGDRSDLRALTLTLLTVICGWAVFHFRLRGWLFAALLALHFAVTSFFHYLDWNFFYLAEEWWLRFMPLTVTMAALGLFIEKRFKEDSPLNSGKMTVGWSRVFYLFLAADMFFGQVGSISGTYAGMTVTLIHMLLCAVLASVWLSGGLAILSGFLGVVALLQWYSALDITLENLPIMLAALALGYGSLGLGYKLLKRRPTQGAEKESALWGLPWLTVWESPLSGWSLTLSLFSLLLTLIIGFDLATWIVRALFGLAFRDFVDFETVRMAVWVLSLTGLLYALAAAAYRRLRVGYLAMAMLIGAWYLYAFFINAWDNLRVVQWYAMPVGLYLLGIGFLEWNRGNKLLGRWLDYAAMLLMMGSLFWQTWVFGWWFALTLMAEGLAFMFVMGVGRRLRRFFYAGLTGAMLAVLGQLLNSLQNVNQWLVFGLIGLLMIAGAVTIERNMEAIKTWRDEVAETWE
ncbi:MAG: hypothetical protein HY865_04270 [Chloroflexi bacterium]|nr:hypothetical protein [Chloroflexota bacterium]